jgi:hypothetical protein
MWNPFGFEVMPVEQRHARRTLERHHVRSAGLPRLTGSGERKRLM